MSKRTLLRLKYRENYPPIISAKPNGVGVASQRLNSKGQTIWIADAHRDDGKRFVVRADEN
jgi:hypothetical protein